jgi:hypothetical protein
LYDEGGAIDPPAGGELKFVLGAYADELPLLLFDPIAVEYCCSLTVVCCGWMLLGNVYPGVPAVEPTAVRAAFFFDL